MWIFGTQYIASRTHTRVRACAHTHRRVEHHSGLCIYLYLGSKVHNPGLLIIYTSTHKLREQAAAGHWWPLFHTVLFFFTYRKARAFPGLNSVQIRPHLWWAESMCLRFSFWCVLFSLDQRCPALTTELNTADLAEHFHEDLKRSLKISQYHNKACILTYLTPSLFSTKSELGWDKDDLSSISYQASKTFAPLVCCYQQEWRG